MYKSIKINYIFCIILTSVSTLWLLILLTNKPLESGTLQIPNIVHYIFFNHNEINFITYLSILSVIKIQKPDAIFIHSDKINIEGPYWNKLKSFNTTINISYFKQPTHVYGQLLSSIYHSSDVARIYILKELGGIYLDNDVLVIRNMDPLRNYNMVVGWPNGEYMGSQVLLAAKSANFLKLWLKGYQRYHPREWYYNAGMVPTEILHAFPTMVHFENVSLGVQNLLGNLHSIEEWNWRSFYTIHLLSRHDPTPRNVSEKLIWQLNSNFGKIARWILSL